MLTLMCRDPILGFVEPAIEIRSATVDDEAVLWHLLNYAGGDPDEMQSVEQLRSDPDWRATSGVGAGRGTAGLIAVEARRAGRRGVVPPVPCRASLATDSSPTTCRSWRSSSSRPPVAVASAGP